MEARCSLEMENVRPDGTNQNDLRRSVVNVAWDSFPQSIPTQISPNSYLLVNAGH